MGATGFDMFAALPDIFQCISLCRDIEQPLIAGNIPHHGCGLPVDREYHRPLGFFELLQERSRIDTECGKGLYVLFNIHGPVAPFEVPIKVSFDLLACL